MIGYLTSRSQLYFCHSHVQLSKTHLLASEFEYRHRPAGAAMFAGTLRPLTRTITSRASTFYTDPSKNQEPEQREILDNALRVNQAGEIAANWIYRGLVTVPGRDPRIGLLIQEMRDQEKRHSKVMDKLQLQAAGFALGAATALMGKEAAMACTEAVETVIREHYDDPLKDFESLPSLHPSIPLLRELIRELRDDELDHLDTAVEHHAQRAPAHALLSTAVGGGCKIAIKLCKRF
ncbi:COQ7-domain-containing protein [Rhizopogon salebrosus TDB-379]|nr:COQ7-domain-containing protein [Rhizopogon salebrosus TDB-379]